MSVAKDNVIKCRTIKTNLPLQGIPMKCQAPIRLRDEEHTNPDTNTMELGRNMDTANHDLCTGSCEKLVYFCFWKRIAIDRGTLFSFTYFECDTKDLNPTFTNVYKLHEVTIFYIITYISNFLPVSRV